VDCRRWIDWLIPAATRKALAFSTPQRTTGIAMVIAAGNFAGTPAVTVTVVLAIFLTFSALITQFVLRRL
jgi:predicted Na+-dependent transporter